MSPEPPEHLLVDAYSQIFRFYHAVPENFTAPDGMCINALFGLTQFLIQLSARTESRRAFAFDLGGSHARKALHQDYKSNRKEMPEPLRLQLPAIRAMIQAFGYTVFECEGYEADDILATLARRMPGPVRIITADKDIAQLVDDSHVCLLKPDTFRHTLMRLDEHAVREKFGVAPAQMVDYLALLGDTADCIPGVPGIGPKTAVAILNRIGHLSDFFAEPERFSAEKWHAKLLDACERIEKNITLIRLNDAVPHPEAEIQDFIAKPYAPDYPEVIRLCKHYALHNALKQLRTLCPAAFEAEATPQKKPEPHADVQLELFAFSESDL